MGLVLDILQIAVEVRKVSALSILLLIMTSTVLIHCIFFGMT